MIIYIKKIAFIFNALPLVFLGIALLAGWHLSFFPHFTFADLYFSSYDGNQCYRYRTPY